MSGSSPAPRAPPGDGAASYRSRIIQSATSPRSGRSPSLNVGWAEELGQAVDSVQPERLGMVAFVIDLFAGIAVCGLLTGAWTLTSGSADSLQRVAQDPTLAGSLHFWPIWVYLGWGA